MSIQIIFYFQSVLRLRVVKHFTHQTTQKKAPTGNNQLAQANKTLHHFCNKKNSLLLFEILLLLSSNPSP